MFSFQHSWPQPRTQTVANMCITSLRLSWGGSYVALHDKQSNQRSHFCSVTDLVVFPVTTMVKRVNLVDASAYAQRKAARMTQKLPFKSTDDEPPADASCLPKNVKDKHRCWLLAGLRKLGAPLASWSNSF